MDRRAFFQTSLTAAGLACCGRWEAAFAKGKSDKAVGKTWQGWKKGHFQIHFIYTGVGESAFYIMPDGTTMLLDCGDHNAIGRGPLAVPVLPGPGRHSGEWIARYVRKVNPAGKDVDYMMLSHYHSDHSGCQSFNAGDDIRDGRRYCLSGFAQAAEYLRFDKAIDRCWPDFDQPYPLKDDKSGALSHMKTFYEYQQKHNGLKIEKFKLGAVNQVALLNSPSKYPEFSVRNICGNGCICSADGTVTDLYADRKAAGADRFNENGMSLGMIFTYGRFKFFTAGDFSDNWELPDGSRFHIEKALATVCEPVNVAKINHHGHNSMPKELVSALRARVWVSCVWDQLHTLPNVIKRISDKDSFGGERVICPGIYPIERRKEDQGNPWYDTVSEYSYEGSHIVLDVEPGGDRYTITHISAEDEAMIVKNVMHFEA